MIKLLKSIQLVTSIAVILLFWLIYPGVMVFFASIVGGCYFTASIGAIYNQPIAIWLALIFSTLTAILATVGVSRFIQNKFDFLTGSFEQDSGFYLPPYMLLAISIGSTLVVIMHVISWKWMLNSKLPQE